MTSPFSFSTDFEQSLHDELVAVLGTWDYGQALRLSQRIHSYEVDGGVLSPVTDNLWQQLTESIMVAEETEL